MTTTTVNGLSGFKIRRATPTASGLVAGVDPGVEQALRELDGLFTSSIFEPKGGGRPAGGVPGLGLKPGLKLPLQPRRGPDEWEPGTLGQAMKDVADAIVAARRRPAKKAAAPPRAGAAPAAPAAAAAPGAPGRPDAGLVKLTQVISEDARLSQLSEQFDSLLLQRWWQLSPNVRIVLDPAYPGLRAYLVLRAYYVEKVRNASDLLSFVVRNDDGAARLVDYGAISAAREWIRRENLNLSYKPDDAPVITELRSAGLSLTEDGFLPALESTVERFMNDTRFEGFLDRNPNLFPSQYRSALIEYLKRAPVTLTDSNVTHYIPLYVQQIAGGIDITDANVTRESSDQDFAVDFFTEDKELLQISRSSVKAAAQLYYTMILGDELQVFDVVNYFTHKYLVGRGFEISDPRLRRDLQMYVFSNQFTVTDAGSNVNRLVDRTQPAERQMFYRQVFNFGGGQVTEDVIVNAEYSRLWKVLMLESAKYLERAQISPNPDSYVSRQNVMQAVEDLQYNLSIHCTGMATVMTPLIYDELSFVTRRILMHEEVRKQVAPSGGSWWKVVETLYEGMKRVRPRATALNNKARLGHSILRSIADYDPATFEQDDTFARFISDVEAFITTQSILQDHLKDALRDEVEDEEEPLDEEERPALRLGPAGAPPGPVAGAPATGDWDF